MATVSYIIPAYRGIRGQAWATGVEMVRASECQCIDAKGAPAHAPWACTRGRHSVIRHDHVVSCVIHWARNHLVAEAMYRPGPPGRPPSEYFLLSDDDMVVKPQFLNRLLSHKVDIVGGICTRRSDPPIPTIKFWNEKEAIFREPLEWDFDSQRLMEVDGIGAAFLLVRRRVFERMGEAFMNCEFEREADIAKGLSADFADAYWNVRAKKRREINEKLIADGKYTQASCLWFDFLWDPTGYERAQFGEDLSFCYKAKKLGFKIYADPQVLPGHLGEYDFSVHDYRQFLYQVKANNPQLPQPKDNKAQLEAKEPCPA